MSEIPEPTVQLIIVLRSGYIPISTLLTDALDTISKVTNGEVEGWIGTPYAMAKVEEIIGAYIIKDVESAQMKVAKAQQEIAKNLERKINLEIEKESKEKGK